MKLKRISLTTRIIILITAVLVTVSGILGAIMSIDSINYANQLVKTKGIEVAGYVASFIDGDEINTLGPSDKGNDVYNEYYNLLKQFKTSSDSNSGEIAYIYIVKYYQEKTFLFLIDPSDDPGAYLDPSAERGIILYTDALGKANGGEPAFDDKAYTDQWGTYYSAFYPVKDSNNNVVCVVGVDIGDAWYKRTVWTNVGSIILASSISVVLGIVIAIIITFRLRKKFEILTSEMNLLEGDVKQLTDDVHYTLIENSDIKPINSSDQLTVLKEKIDLTRRELKQYIDYAHQQAFVDTLTGLGNRTAYFERIQNGEYKIANGIADFAVVVVDINGLKHINDEYGHEVGDKSIIVVAELINEVFETYKAYRIGGDEFVVILTSVSMNRLKRYFKVFDERFVIYNQNNEDLPFNLTVSRGFAIFNSDIDNCYADVFKRADEEMYKDKAKFYEENKN